MEPVIGISWPRSGHHMLVRLLKHYFSSEFTYCPFYGKIPDCCKSIPCDNGMAFTKNHDWKLKTAQLSGAKYLIQYRSFLPSTISNFELHLKNGNGEDSAEGFRRFSIRELQRYTIFKEKWVYSKFASRQCTVLYDEFVTSPCDHLERVVRFFAPGVPVNKDRILQTVRTTDPITIENGIEKEFTGKGVSPARTIESFRWFDSDFFTQLDRVANRRLPEYKLLRFFTSLAPGMSKIGLHIYRKPSNARMRRLVLNR